MWLDVIVLGMIGGFGYMGARRGAAVSFMGVASLVCSYWAAIEAGQGFGPAVAAGLGLPEMAGIPIAGSLAFFAVFALMIFTTRFVKDRAEDRDKTPRDRFLGAAFGGMRGVFVALLISYLAIWLDALRMTGNEAIPEVGPSAAASVTEALVVAGVESALSDTGPTARVVARIAGRPGTAFSELAELLESPHIERLQQDQSFWFYVEAGSIDAAMNQSSYVAMSRDLAFREQLGELGLIDPAAAADSEAFRDSAYEMLAQVGPRIRGLRQNPDLQLLMQDPEIIAMVQTGDTLGLLGHEEFRALVAQVVSDPNDDQKTALR